MVRKKKQKDNSVRIDRIEKNMNNLLKNGIVKSKTAYTSPFKNE